MTYLRQEIQKMREEAQNDRERMDNERIRMDAERMRMDAKFSQLLETVQNLEARSADLTALLVRARQQQPQQVEAAQVIQYQATPKPAPEPPKESPRATPAEWFRIMREHEGKA